MFNSLEEEEMQYVWRPRRPFGLPMDIDDTDRTISSVSSNGNTASTTIKEKARRVYSNVRVDGQVNRQTHLKGTNIFYFDDLLIGSGATGNVYEGFHMSEDKRAAVKRVNEDEVEVSKNELFIWKELGSSVTPDNVNIVQLFEWTIWTDGGRRPAYYFAMDLATCDLQFKIDELRELQTGFREKLVGYLRDAARGLKWLHDKRIIHRDVKPKNILIFETDDGREIAKVGDFGISRKVGNISTGTDSRGQETSDWMSPEGIKALDRKGRCYSSFRMDVFSLGMTAHFAMSYGSHPFRHDGQFGGLITYNIVTREPNSLLDILPKEHCGNHLFQWAMRKDYKERPKMLQVLNHPFFWDSQTCLKFVIDVARLFDKTGNSIVSELKDNLNFLYNILYFHNESKEDQEDGFWFVNWGKDLGSDLYELLRGRVSSKSKSRYDTRHVMSLVTLIRDKYAHASEMKPELLQDQYFGEDGDFCEEKFINFFMKKFPYLVIFLYTVMCKPMKQYSFMNSFKRMHNLVGLRDIPSLPPLKKYFEENVIDMDE